MSSTQSYLPSDFPKSTQFAELAEQLRSMSNALVEFSQVVKGNNSPSVSLLDKKICSTSVAPSRCTPNETVSLAQNFNDNPLITSGETPNVPNLANGETRVYHLCPSSLRHERKLLQNHDAKDFLELLDKLDLLLVGLIKLMKSTHPSVKVKGHVMVSLGCMLEQAWAVVLGMRNVYRNVRRVS